MFLDLLLLNGSADYDDLFYIYRVTVWFLAIFDSVGGAVVEFHVCGRTTSA